MLITKDKQQTLLIGGGKPKAEQKYKKRNNEKNQGTGLGK